MGLIEAEFLAAYLTFLWLLCSANRQKLFKDILEWIENAKHQSLLGSSSWPKMQNSPEACLSSKLLHEMSIECHFRGKSSALALRTVQAHLRAAARSTQETHRLFTTLCLKVGAVTSLAFLGRAAVLQYLRRVADLSQGTDDRAMLSCGLILTIILMYYIKNHLPESWLWEHGFTETGRRWLISEFSGAGDLPTRWGMAWQQLDDREQFLGIDLTTDKALIVQDWVYHLDAEQSQRIIIFETALPFLEIVIGGGLAIIILLHPILIICNH